MTWEQTIQYIRKNPEYSSLIKDTYLDADLKRNVESYALSEEFIEIINILSSLPLNNPLTIADVGSGNGISSISFAKQGHQVFAIEPNQSDTIGVGAINILKSNYQLENIQILTSFGELIDLKSEFVDLYFARQTMHHANDLKAFVKEGARILKSGGYFFTVRDHVVLDMDDKKWFLETHPLQRYYGGENAYTLKEYVSALEEAGLSILKVIKYFDSPINYSPLKKNELKNLPRNKELQHWKYFSEKYPVISKIPGSFLFYKLKAGFCKGKMMDERTIPGRMYSFLAQKK